MGSKGAEVAPGAAGGVEFRLLSLKRPMKPVGLKGAEKGQKS